MSTGGSGGAYTSLQIADAFPGLFDGVSISATFPDALVDRARRASTRTCSRTTSRPSAAERFTTAQKMAISGYQGMKAFIDAANQSQRTDPVPDREDIEGYQSARWNAAVPAALRYDPGKNPEGRAADGVRRREQHLRRRIRRPAPRCGRSTTSACSTASTRSTPAPSPPAQFLDLNEKIGGFDQDANYVADAHRRRRRRHQARVSERPHARRQRRACVDSDLRQRHVERDAAAITTAGSTSRCASALRQANGNARQHGDVAQHDAEGRAQVQSLPWAPKWPLYYAELL